MASQIQEKIIEVLKNEVEYVSEDSSYNQWVLGVSIKKDRSGVRKIGSLKYIARVVVKTNESPYVDGMDIAFTVPDDEVIIDPNYFEKTPEYQGGTVEDSLNWLRELEDICYLQLENPLTKTDDSND